MTIEELSLARRFTMNAQECRKLASTSHDVENRAILLNIAEAWDIMAAQQVRIIDSRALLEKRSRE